MKKLTLLPGLALATGLLTFSLNASAQISIDSADLPHAELTIVTDSDGTSKPLLGSPSPNTQAWDFSALHKQKAYTIQFKAPTATPYSSVFTESNLADTTIKESGYNYFNLSASAFNVVGAEEYASFTYMSNTYILPVRLQFIPTQLFEQASLPATYGEKIQGVAWGEDIINETISIISKEKVTDSIVYSDTVDAWGTMKMPNGNTYPVLRQKHDEVDYENLYGYAFNTWAQVGSTIVTKKYQYNWYAKGIGFTLVEMDMDSTSSTIKDIIFWDTTIIANLGINQITGLSGSVNVYPNPCSSQITFTLKLSETHTSGQQEQQLSVFDITGRQVETIEMKNGMSSLNTTMYADGMYLYELTDKSGNLIDRGKFTVQK